MDKFTDMTLDEVIVSDHEHFIKLAEDGCINAAKSLMADAAICIQHGVALPEPLATYIGKALYMAAITPETILKDFNIKRKPGSNKHEGDFYKHLICLEVQYASFNTGRYTTTNKGEGAYSIVAANYYHDEDHVRRIFRNHKRWNIKEKSQDELEEMLPTYRKLFQK